MPKRDQLLSEMAHEEVYGVLLAAQMGGVPNELQLILQTATYDAAVQGLRERTRYVVRALGVREHRLSLGVFGALVFPADHPLLIPHNTPSTAVFFRGTPDNADALALDITQAHATVFGLWRHLAQDINHAAPLMTLLASGGGVLGEMPRPAAEKLAAALETHGLETKLMQDPEWSATDEHGRSKAAQLLVIDEGYIVALDFSVEFLGKGQG